MVRQELNIIFYNNEMTFKFETFYKKLKATFDTMEKYWEVRSEQDKVRTFLKKIHMKNQNL